MSAKANTPPAALGAVTDEELADVRAHAQRSGYGPGHTTVRLLATIAARDEEIARLRGENAALLEMSMRLYHDDLYAEARKRRRIAEARVAQLEAALREILRDTDEPFGFASYDEAHAWADAVLGIARAALRGNL